VDLGAIPPTSVVADHRRARLVSFVQSHLHPAERIRAVLTRTGEPKGLSWVLETIGELASLYGLGDAVATHRAIVVTDRRVLVIRMPWARSWSLERGSELAAVAVSGLERATQPGGGLLVKPGSLVLRFGGGRDVEFVFGVGGSDLPRLQFEAESVASAIQGANHSSRALEPDPFGNDDRVSPGGTSTI
jgi:hypothetical protein